jgi:hypothetical protein
MLQSIYIYIEKNKDLALTAKRLTKEINKVIIIMSCYSWHCKNTFAGLYSYRWFIKLRGEKIV